MLHFTGIGDRRNVQLVLLNLINKSEVLTDNTHQHPLSHTRFIPNKGHGDLLEPILAHMAGVHPGEFASPSQGHI